MLGQILIGKDDGRRVIYVPEAHVVFSTQEGGRKGLLFCAERTEGLCEEDESLEHNFQFTTMVEVPDDLVTYALEGSTEKDEVMGEMEEILKSEAGKVKRDSHGKSQTLKNLEVNARNRNELEQIDHAMALRAQALLTNNRSMQ